MGKFRPKPTASGTRQALFEVLERREMLAVFTVTNLNDAVVTAANQAPGTLRQAIFDANDLPGADTIQFASNLSGTIQLMHIGDTGAGSSAFVVSSEVTIRGNTNGITIARAEAAPEMRLFRVTSSGDLALESITLTGGVVRGADGASGQPGQTVHGGAILSEGMVQIVASTLHGNTAIGGNGSGNEAGRGHGGAIASLGGTVSVKNSTISGNAGLTGTGSSSPNSFGGGIYSLEGSIEIYHSTLTSNVASTGRQLFAVCENTTRTAHIFSSILAQEDAPTSLADVVVIGDPAERLLVSASHNILRRQVGLDGTHYIVADPKLAPLANNGGPTKTHALLAGSPALNAGTAALALTTDQRGPTFARTFNSVIDIGAYELQGVPPAVPGDYNRDGLVDAADYVMWRKTIGRTGSVYFEADGSGNGAIDFADHAPWVDGYGNRFGGAGGGSASQQANERLESPAANYNHAARDAALLSALMEWDVTTRGRKPTSWLAL